MLKVSAPIVPRPEERRPGGGVFDATRFRQVTFPLFPEGDFGSF